MGCERHSWQGEEWCQCCGMHREEAKRTAKRGKETEDLDEREELKGIKSALHAREQMEAYYPQGYLNTYGLVYESGKNILFTNKVCYASLKSREQQEKVKYFIDYVFAMRNNQRHKKLKEHETKFLNWLTRDSIWARVFITKRPEIIYNKGTIFRTDMPARFVIGAAMLVRYLQEQPGIIENWDTIVKVRPKRDKTAALVFAHLISTDQDGKIGYATNTMNHNHSYFQERTFGLEHFKNLLDEKLFYEEGDTMATNPDKWRSMVSIFSPPKKAPNTNLYGEPPRFKTPLVRPPSRESQKTNSWGSRYSSYSFIDHDVGELFDKFMTLNMEK